MMAFWKRLKENQECSIRKTKTIAVFVTNITKQSFFKLKVRQRFLFVCLFFKDSGKFFFYIKYRAWQRK